VPSCTQKGTVDPEGNRVGIFGFLKDQNLRKEWLVKIRRDVGPHLKLTEATKVCSLHFQKRLEEVKNGLSLEVSLANFASQAPSNNTKNN